MNKLPESYCIRELSRKDLPFINEWRNDRDVMLNLGSPFRYIDAEIDEKWFDGYLLSRSNTVRLVVCSKINDQAVGVVYLLGIDWVTRSCEFAIMIGDTEHQGKGLGTFSAQFALRHAFSDLNLNRVHLTVLEKNKRAIRVYEKLAFKREGLLRQAVYKNGSYQNLLKMAILASEFYSDQHKT